MSCAGEKKRQSAGLRAASRIAGSQVDGAARCLYPGCNQPLNTRQECPGGHSQCPEDVARALVKAAYNLQSTRSFGLDRQANVVLAQQYARLALDVALELGAAELTQHAHALLGDGPIVGSPPAAITNLFAGLAADEFVVSTDDADRLDDALRASIGRHWGRWTQGSSVGRCCVVRNWAGPAMRARVLAVIAGQRLGRVVASPQDVRLADLPPTVQRLVVLPEPLAAPVLPKAAAAGREQTPKGDRQAAGPELAGQELRAAIARYGEEIRGSQVGAAVVGAKLGRLAEQAARQGQDDLAREAWWWQAEAYCRVEMVASWKAVAGDEAARKVRMAQAYNAAVQAGHGGAAMTALLYLARLHLGEPPDVAAAERYLGRARVVAARLAAIAGAPYARQMEDWRAHMRALVELARRASRPAAAGLREAC